MDLADLLEKLNDSDAKDLADEIKSDLDCAESVETEADFRANLRSARDNAEKLLRHLTSLLEDTK